MAHSSPFHGLNALIETYGMIPPGSTVLCACSGGADSVYLLHRLYLLRERMGFRLAAAHYNHQLRGEESRRDEAFVRRFVAQWCGPAQVDGHELPGVPLYVGRGDVAAQAGELGRGLEETAREMRYAFLRETAAELGGALIATAHTADDNGETILLHLLRGSGLRGLTGIRPVGEGLIRPMLTTTRAQVEEYLRLYGLPHVEDSSNRDESFSRNRLRWQVVPELEDMCPGFARRTAETAALLRTDEDYLTGLAEKAVADFLPRAGTLRLPAAAVGDLPDALAPRAARLLLARLRDGDADLAAPHLGGVVALCRGRDPSAQLDLPEGITARREYEMLVLTRETAPPALEEASLPMPGQLRTGEWTLTCAAAVYQGEPQSGREFWLAGAEGLTVRPRRTGDRLERPGRPGRTVKKIMIDQKLPRHLRDTVPVLDSGGRVAAVAELGPDAAFLPRLGEPCWHITAKRKGEYFMLEKDIQEILFSEEQLAQRVKEIAGEINRDYVGQEIMLVSVLRGSFVFMADLCRRIDLPCTVDFMAVSSYGGGTSSSGQVQITKDLSSDITGKNIIVVEDILDSGNTLSYLLKVLEQRSPASIRLCTLLDKPERRVKPVEVHYSGFTIPDAFVVGYGLDYAEHYRNLPYIGILKPEVYGG